MNIRQDNFSGASEDYKRRLWVVIFLNACMFIVEMHGGYFAKSQALKADALDFLADTLTYGLSLYAIKTSKKTKAMIAGLKGFSLMMMGLWIAGSTVYLFLTPSTPKVELMGWIGFLALIVNLISVLLILKYKHGDVNIRSVWLCSRNDAIGNVGVIVTAFLSGWINSGWPDLIAACFMSALFIHSSFQIFSQSYSEWKS